MTAALQLPEREIWTVDDLAELSDDHRYELINGRLVVTSPIGPHQDLNMRVAWALQEGCPPDHAPFMELSILIDRYNQPRPDVVAVKLDHIDTSPVPAEDVVLVVETLSKDNTLKSMREKERRYVAAGIPSYWVINPLHGVVTVTEFVLDQARREYDAVAATSGVFETDLPWPVRLDLPALSQRYERLLAGARRAPVAQ